MEEKTTLEYLADALRLTHRAILAGNPTDEQKKLLSNSNLHLLLMESQLAGLGAQEAKANQEEKSFSLKRCRDHNERMIAALDKAEVALLAVGLNEAADECREAMTGEAVPDQWRKTNSDHS